MLQSYGTKSIDDDFSLHYWLGDLLHSQCALRRLSFDRELGWRSGIEAHVCSCAALCSHYSVCTLIPSAKDRLAQHFRIKTHCRWPTGLCNPFSKCTLILESTKLARSALQDRTTCPFGHSAVHTHFDMRFDPNSDRTKILNVAELDHTLTRCDLGRVTQSC